MGSWAFIDDCIASKASLIEMDNILYTIICSPFSVTATILNILFFFCVLFPPAGVNLRQPLSFLIYAVLCNSTVQQCVVTLTIVLGFLTPPEWLLVIAKSFTYQTFCANFASNAWISVFYYMKIVPQKGAIALWVKRNITVLAYVGYVLEQLTLMASVSLGTVMFLLPQPTVKNQSISTPNQTMATSESLGAFLFKQSTLLFLLYASFPFLALSFSWGRTFMYLRRHMKRMEESSSPFSQPQHQNHMRVTVMGILQTALFVPSCLWSLLIAVMYNSKIYGNLDGNKHITLTITSVSGLGNIMCLGYSQSVFRLRAVAVIECFRKAMGWSEQTEEHKDGEEMQTKASVGSNQ